MFLEISKQFPPAPPNAAKVAFCRFLGNRAVRTGGGFSNGYESDVIVVDTCVFEDNTSSRGGGAYLDYESLNDLRNCTFLRNQALAGGGVLGEEDNHSTLTNCTFLGNAARWSGGGVAFRFSGSLGRQITHCTIVGNAAGNGPGGLDLLPEQGFGLIAIESSIIWGNSGSSPMPPGEYTFSCVQGAAPLPGVGNINSPPQFAGWPGPEEMYVDPTAPAGGDGTQARPFQDLRAAVSGYQLALLPGSPCVGAGKGGTTMGASAVGPPPAPGSTSRTLHLAAGTYSLEGVSLANGVSVLGAGPRETTLLGPAIGLSTGALLDSVRVIGGAPGAISIALGESPRLWNTIAMGGSPELDDYFVYQITEGFTGGFGVYCAKSSSPALDHCTIAGNWAAKLPEATTGCQSPSSSASGVFAREASPVIQSSIIAINAGGSIIGNATVGHSLVEGAAPWPGEGNLTGDPAFAGWPMLDSYVDASAPEGGDGSAARPFSTMASAIAEFDFALTQGSPCRGAGADGTDMGAGTGASQRPPAPSRTIHVAAGTYTVPDTSFALGLSLEGAGRDETLLLGTIGGLRTGASLSGVTIEGGGLEGAVMLGACESPEIRSIRARRSLRGLSVMGGSPTIADCIFTNCAVGIFATPGARPEIVRAHFVSNSSGVESRGGTLKLVNCVFEANSVGLSTYEGGSANLLQCTFHAHPGTSVQCPLPSSDVLLTNCILWQDGAGLAPMCGGLKNCLTLRDPLFVRLPVLNFSQYEILNSRGLYYSVPNWIVQAGDYHLQPGSPAVDIGLVEGAPPDDFEGNQRPCGAAPDAGAYELANCEGELFRRGDVNADAKLDLTDAIRTLNYLFGGGEEPGCLATADVSDSDGLNVADPIVLLGFLFLGTTQPAPPFPDCGLDPTPGDFTCATYPVCGG